MKDVQPTETFRRLLEKIFPHCKIDYFFNHVEIIFCFGDGQIKQAISSELLMSQDEELLKQTKFLAEAEIEFFIIERYFKRNAKTKKYIVSPIIKEGMSVIHPKEFQEKLESLN